MSLKIQQERTILRQQLSNGNGMIWQKEARADGLLRLLGAAHRGTWPNPNSARVMMPKKFHRWTDTALIET